MIRFYPLFCIFDVFHILNDFPHKNTFIFTFSPFGFKILYFILFHHRNNSGRVKSHAIQSKTKNLSKILKTPGTITHAKCPRQNCKLKSTLCVLSCLHSHLSDPLTSVSGVHVFSTFPLTPSKIALRGKNSMTSFTLRRKLVIPCKALYFNVNHTPTLSKYNFGDQKVKQRRSLKEAIDILEHTYVSDPEQRSTTRSAWNSQELRTRQHIMDAPE